MNHKFRTQVEIDRRVWAQVKALSTTKGDTLVTTLDYLLREVLATKGYSIPLENEVEK